MKQEDKELLLKYLCMALPYKVVIEYNNDGCSSTRELGLGSLHDFMCDNAECKPYLRPMSSMTEEEEEEYWDIINSKSPEMPVGEIPSIETIAQCSVIVLDWLLSKEFDIKGLIPMGLAIAVTEENNPYKK